ncbi:MAG: autotransporter-associated beta strand repeat-containing protein [Verrucomicrobia bacterium]|nr:autotransporter-associated beta strand repeat-containing protein [Verrucomicrobiota bacterium]
MNLVNQPENRIVDRRCRSQRALFTGLMLGVANSMVAVTSVWVPTSGTQTWFSPTNWSPSQPTSADTVVVGSNSTALVEGTAVASAGNLGIAAGAVTVGDFNSGTLNVSGQVAVVGGRLNVNLGTLSFNSLTVGSGGAYSDTKFGSLRLTGVNSTIQLSSVSMLVNGVVSGSSGLILSGPGTLAFANDNTYTGGTTVGATSSLLVGNNGATGSLGAGNVTNAGTLAFGRTDSTVVANLITGTGAVRQVGTGTTTLTADNTYSGGTTVTGGTLQVGNGGTTGSLGAGAVAISGSLVFNRSDDIVIGNVISGTGSLGQFGTGKLTLTGNNTFTGTTVVSTGTLAVGDGGTTGSIGSGNVLVNAGALLAFNRSDNVVVSGQIGGAG